MQKAHKELIVCAILRKIILNTVRIGSGMNKTYKTFFTARNRLLRDIVSLTDSQKDVFMSGKPGAKERKRGSISLTLNVKTDTS